VLAVYPREGTLFLDYPYTVIATDRRQADAARLLERELREGRTRELLRDAGFRASDSVTVWPPTETVPVSLPQPSAAEVRKIVSDWYKLSRGIRDLTLIDVSASMAEAAGPDLTRLQVATQAAQRIVSSLPGDTEIGVWQTSTPLQGARGEQVNPEIGRLSDNRQRLIKALGEMHADPDTHTGLYRSVLAAFRTMTRTYQPGQVNSILVLTAAMDDGSGISLRALISALRDEYDPARPVQIVMMGIGKGADHETLRKIAKATGGSAFSVSTPQQIQMIILNAISRRICAPKC
jgi:hypothetical protein